MMGDRILEAEQELYQGKLLLDKHQYSVSVNKAYRAVLAAAKALLVTEGLDPSTDAETFGEFEQRIASKGVVPATYLDLTAQLQPGPPYTTHAVRPAKMDLRAVSSDLQKRPSISRQKDLNLSRRIRHRT